MGKKEGKNKNKGATPGGRRKLAHLTLSGLLWRDDVGGNGWDRQPLWATDGNDRQPTKKRKSTRRQQKHKRGQEKKEGNRLVAPVYPQQMPQTDEDRAEDSEAPIQLYPVP